MLKTVFPLLHTTLYLCMLCLCYLEVWMERDNLCQIIFTIEELTTLYLFSELTLRHNKKKAFFDFHPPVRMFYVRMYCEGPTLNTWEFEYCGYVLNQTEATILLHQNEKDGDSHCVRNSIDFLKYASYKFTTKCKVSVSHKCLMFPFLF